MELGVPFRGTAAVARGAITRHVLFGPRFRRLFPDVYVPAGVPVDLALRARAAALLTAPDGVVSGWSAAELLGASCGPAGAPAEITLRSGAHGRAPTGLELHRERLCADEITTLGGIAVTTPLRTAYDIARWRDLVEGVVALDALLARFSLDADDVRVLRSRHLGARGSRRLEPALRLVDLRAESPMETRIRVALRHGGLPAPCVQWPVMVSGRRFHLDLAYPEVRLGVEYDGRHHLAPSQALRDLEREGLLGTAGWRVLRFDARLTLTEPHLVAERTAAELLRRGHPAW